MKNKLAEVVDKAVIEQRTETQNLCSCEDNVVEDLCSLESYI